MKLIPFEQVKSLLQSKLFNAETKEGGWVLALSPSVIDDLDNLSTIDLSVIDEMVEEYEDSGLSGQYIAVKSNALRELKERLSTNL